MSGTSYTDEYPGFLKVLAGHKVEYLIIGAYAVMIHTKTPGATKDMDTWIRRTEENAIRLAAALKEFGGLEVSGETILKPGQRIEIKSEAFKIGIWTSQEILGFEEAWERKLTDTVEDFSINVISKEDLVKLKRHFDRPQDRLDLSLLEETEYGIKPETPGGAGLICQGPPLTNAINLLYYNGAVVTVPR